MGKALTYIGGILLAILCALLLVPRFVDWNNFRGAFEEEASRVLGREVRVGGSVNLRLLPSPYVRFEKLRISDNSGTLGEPFFRAESFTMGLAVTPLLRGALEATQIELSEPVLTLAIDKDGRGNWRDVALSPSAAALLPAEVRLQEVAIVNGRLNIRSGDGELLRLDAINGEFSADNIDGPFKFRGLVGWNGEPREVRIATARPDPDGGVRFKAVVKPQVSAATYTLDAKLSDIAGKPKLEGDVAARVPLTPAARTAAATGAKGAGDGESLELRSRIQGDAYAINLPEVLVAFDQAGQPQLLAGDASAGWRDGFAIRIGLKSSWLDLDKLAGSSAGAGPVEAVRTLLLSLIGLLPTSARADLRLAIEQVNLGGEAVSGLALALERVRGPMQIRELQLGLPGGTRLELSGTLDAQPTEIKIAGDLALRGTSYARFLSWAAKGQTLVETRNDGPFALQGRLGLSAHAIELADVSGEFLGAPLKGHVGYGWGQRRRIDVRLEGQQIDISALVPGGLDPNQLKTLLWPQLAAGPPATGSPPRSTILGLVEAGAADAHFTVRASELGDGQRILRDIDTALSIEQGQLNVSMLRLTTSDGVRIDAAGRIADAGKLPRGTLQGTIAAGDAAALDALLAMLGLGPEVEGPGPGDKARGQRLARLAPLRLAGTLRIGQRGGTATDLELDGTLAGNRATARIEADAGPQRWREGLVDLAISIDGAGTGLALSELLAGEAGLVHQLDAGPGGGRLVVRATGRPDAGMLALASLKGPQLDLDLDGRLTLHPDGSRDFAGGVRVEAARGQPLLSLIGLGAAGSIGEHGLAGNADVDARAGNLKLKIGSLRLGGSDVAGQLQLARSPSPPPAAGAVATPPTTAIDAVLTIPAATMAGLLSPVIERKRVTAAREGQTPLVGVTRQSWPDVPFDFTALDAIQGRIKLAIGRLELEDGLALTDASLDVELTPGQIKVSNLDGRALGGDFKARLVLERAPLAGVSLAGALRIDDASLEAIAGKAVATGSAGLLIQFSGRALSPHALVSGVQGKGEIALGQVQLARISPATVGRAVDAMLDGKTEASGDILRKLLRDGLASAGGLTLAPAKIPLQIGEGAVRVQRHAFETPDARGSFDITVDLAALKVDSEWRVEAKTGARPRAAATKDGAAKEPSARERAPLPGISVVYVGPLKALAALEPRINADALEREVLVRRMERDVEELERLRREDEERIKREQDRQRQIEEDRKRALEQGVAPPAMPPATVGAPAAPLRGVPLGTPVPPVPAGASPSLAGGARPGVVQGEAPPPAASPGLSSSGPAPPPDGPKRPPRPASSPPPRFDPFQPFAN